MKYYRLEPALTAISKKPAEEFGMVHTYPNEPLSPYCMIGHLHIHHFGLKTLGERMKNEIDWLRDVADAYAIPYRKVQELYIFECSPMSGYIPYPFQSMEGFDNLIPPEARKSIMLQTLRTLMTDDIVDYAVPLLNYLDKESLTTNAT